MSRCAILNFHFGRSEVKVIEAAPGHVGSTSCPGQPSRCYRLFPEAERTSQMLHQMDCTDKKITLWPACCDTFKICTKPPFSQSIGLMYCSEQSAGQIVWMRWEWRD